MEEKEIMRTKGTKRKATAVFTALVLALGALIGTALFMGAPKKANAAKIIFFPLPTYARAYP